VLQSPRYVLLLSVLSMLGLSLIFVFSSTAGSAGQTWTLTKHAVSIAIGILVMWLFMNADYRDLRRFTKVAVFVAAALLLYVLLNGAKINGAKRWILLGPLSFQPSELAKIVFVVYFADFFTRKQEIVREFWSGFFPAVVMAGLCLAMIVFEPDLGTTILLGAVIFGMLLVAGFRLAHVVPTLVVVAIVMGALMVFKFAHSSGRLDTFMKGEYDYQVSQALIALGSGGLSGTGLGEGLQKLNYVPLATTDFAFSVIGEEAGLLGTGTVALLYLALGMCGLAIARRAKDTFGQLMACGLTCLFIGQAIINMFVVTGLFPNKGIALPFISAGGSAMVFMLAGAGILLSVGKIAEQEGEPAVVGGRLRMPEAA